MINFQAAVKGMQQGFYDFYMIFDGCFICKM